MKLFHSTVQAAKRMPRSMRVVSAFLAIFSLFGLFSLLGLLSVTPGRGMYINDVPVGAIDFWRSGAGPAFFGLGVLSAITLFGFITARPWSRYMFVLTVGLLTVGSALQQSTNQVGSFAAAVACCTLAAWYAFFHRPVQIYFQVRPENAA